MKDFGLAGEGITDQAVLENILVGLFSNIDPDDLRDEVAQLQPRFDATDRNKNYETGEDSFGGWPRLFAYLKSKGFRDDVLNHQFMIIQPKILS